MLPILREPAEAMSPGLSRLELSLQIERPMAVGGATPMEKNPLTGFIR
jgi:hypothetical protein